MNSPGVFRKIDSFIYSSMLIAAMDGLMLQWILNRDLFDLKQVSQALFDGFLNGIRS